MGGVNVDISKTKMRSIDLFSGIGGITNALEEWCEPVVYCENEPYAQSVLLSRMQKGDLPKAPIWDDVCTLSTEELPEIDLICGGFPCQDISIAGRKEGLGGERSGLVYEIFKIADKAKAPFIFLENVPNIRTYGAETVCKELSQRGYDSRWCMLSARALGAPHKRERWFLLAHRNSYGSGKGSRKEVYKGISEAERKNSDDLLPKLPNTKSEGLQRCKHKERRVARYDWWETEPDILRVVNGIPRQNDRIKALGNSVVPQCVREAFKILSGL